MQATNKGVISPLLGSSPYLYNNYFQNDNQSMPIIVDVPLGISVMMQ